MVRVHVVSVDSKKKRKKKRTEIEKMYVEVLDKVSGADARAVWRANWIYGLRSLI